MTFLKSIFLVVPCLTSIKVGSIVLSYQLGGFQIANTSILTSINTSQSQMPRHATSPPVMQISFTKRQKPVTRSSPTVPQPRPSLLPVPRTSIQKMDEKQLNAWIQELRKELQTFTDVSKTFSNAATTIKSGRRATIIASVQAVPPRFMTYAKQILGKPLNPANASPDDFLNVSTSLVFESLKLNDMISQANDELEKRRGKRKGSTSNYSKSTFSD